VKKVEGGIDTGDKEARDPLFRRPKPNFIGRVTKGLLHKNTVSRKLSRLATRINGL